MPLSATQRALYEGSLLRHQRDSQIWGAIFNRNYEGSISGGKSLKIFTGVDVTGGTYDPANVDAMSGIRSALDVTSQTLTIDQYKAVGFYLDDVDKAFTNLNLLDDAAESANAWLTNTSEGFLSALVITSGTDYGATLTVPATPLAPLSLAAAGAAYDLLVDLKVACDVAKMGPVGRSVVVAPWIHGLLLKDDRFVSFGQDALKNGAVGSAAGFTVVVSNRSATKDTADCVVAINTDCGTFASAIDDIAAGKLPNSFKQAVDVLQVYGAAIYRPTNAQYICVEA